MKRREEATVSVFSFLVWVWEEIIKLLIAKSFLNDQLISICDFVGQEVTWKYLNKHLKIKEYS